MILRRILWLTAAVPILSAPAQPACAETLIPVEQERFTSVALQTDCQGQTSDGEAAKGFEPFDSSVTTEQQCLGLSIFTTASAHQISSIGGSSMTAFASAQYAVQSPGSIVASAVSNFAVTFELPRTSVFSLNGLLLGDGPVPGVETLIELVGPGGTLVFSHTLNGPFPAGEATQQGVEENLTLETGVYTLHARALAADAIDIAAAFLSGTSALNLAVSVSVLGDLNGDEVVDIVDLLALLAGWGPCPPGPCPADLNDDGVVGIADFLALLANWS